jgi:hypothetical protein
MDFWEARGGLLHFYRENGSDCFSRRAGYVAWKFWSGLTEGKYFTCSEIDDAAVFTREVFVLGDG